MKYFGNLSSKFDGSSTLNAELRMTSETRNCHLIKETDDLSCNVFPPCLLVVHNASACRQNHVAKLSAWQQLHYPLLEIFELNIVSRRDHTGLVEAAIELDNNLAVAVVVNLFEFADVAWESSCQSPSLRQVCCSRLNMSRHGVNESNV